jgi:hypothetical protein
MDQEKFNWKRLLITTLIVVISMGVAGGTVWFFKDKEVKALEQQNSLSFIAGNLDMYCNVEKRPTDRELEQYENLPGISQAKVETVDGVKQLTIGYSTGNGWATVGYPLDCKKSEANESNNNIGPKSIKDFELKKLTGESSSMGTFSEIQYADLTNDGKDEALVIFTYEGTGSIKNFYIFGVQNSEAKLLYSKKSLSKAQIAIETLRKEDGPVVTASWIDPNDPINIDKSNADMSVSENTSKQYRWNGSAFIELYMQ